ncbi:hypothetical protein DFH09DRAFT_1103061 [Mycena vulgaris]|nr:hypothetical protein DFH09DRAFT_1103061 [Mycena vulgaris]
MRCTLSAGTGIRIRSQSWGLGFERLHGDLRSAGIRMQSLDLDVDGGSERQRVETTRAWAARGHGATPGCAGAGARDVELHLHYGREIPGLIVTMAGIQRRRARTSGQASAEGRDGEGRRSARDEGGRGAGEEGYAAGGGDGTRCVEGIGARRWGREARAAERRSRGKDADDDKEKGRRDDGWTWMDDEERRKDAESEAVRARHPRTGPQRKWMGRAMGLEGGRRGQGCSAGWLVPEASEKTVEDGSKDADPERAGRLGGSATTASRRVGEAGDVIDGGMANRCTLPVTSTCSTTAMVVSSALS